MITIPFFDPRHSSLLLKEILSTASEAVVGETKDGRVVLVNDGFLHLVGWTTQYSGQPMDALISSWTAGATHPQALEVYFQSCRAGLQPCGPIELQPNSGQIVEAQFHSITTDAGEVIGLWHFKEWRTSALAWVSHEIKNPLNAVLGFSELLAESLGNTPASDAVQESLRGLRIGAKHLQSVLGDLLNLSRLESGVVEAHPEWTPLGRFLEDFKDLYQTRFRRRGLDFLVQGPDGVGVELLVDPGRLTQILGNLLTNSLRFTKRGWVALKVGHHGASWEFSVEDSGVGIPLDQQKTIFEPFVQKQGQDVQKFGGTGLGLAICRSLALSMGATLGLESVPGSGSRFTVTFDRLEWRPEAVTSPGAVPEALPGSLILVADDERSNHLLVQGYLRGTGVTVLSAYDGIQAVDLWKLNRPRLVMMDLRMPRLSGLESARRIRALDPHGQTRFLAMSATKLSPIEAVEGRGLWTGFLEKPFNKKEFFKFLANHLTFLDELSTSP